MRHLSGFQRDILFVIADMGSPYGLEIKRELEEYYGEDINHGRLYPNLNELSEIGYLEIGERDKRTNEYTLTDQGQEAIHRRQEWQQRRAAVPS